MNPLFVLSILIVPLAAADLATRELRCEYHANPLAIGTTQPRFSWKIHPVDPSARDVAQSAYEVQVARDFAGFEQEALWSSGKISSAATDQIA